MKTPSKTLLATLAVTLVGATAAFADHTVRRIDHPNGPATYVAAPHDRSTATIGVYAGERSFGGRDVTVRTDANMKDSGGRTLVPLHRGRGEVIYVPTQR
jgi:hypothetical protein